MVLPKYMFEVKNVKEVNETVKKIFSQKCLLPDVIN